MAGAGWGDRTADEMDDAGGGTSVAALAVEEDTTTTASETMVWHGSYKEENGMAEREPTLDRGKPRSDEDEDDDSLNNSMEDGAAGCVE